jgi:hypothetical protein
MLYSQGDTLNHKIAVAYKACLLDLDDLIHQEDNLSVGNVGQFNSSVVIDLDSVEVLKAQAEVRQQNSTMDCSFAIKDKKTEMLLVEFRFNYSNLKNLNRNKLISKVSGSILLLGNSIPINSNYIFIFHKNLVAQATSRFFRMNPRIPTNYIVMDLDYLKATYF